MHDTKREIDFFPNLEKEDSLEVDLDLKTEPGMTKRSNEAIDRDTNNTQH